MLATIILVGADKGGVGKTMVSRALTDFIRVHNISHTVFDTETGADKGVLKRFCPGAELVDIATVKGQMQIFDTLRDEWVTIVDLRAGLLTSTLEAMRNSGVMADVRKGKARLILLHVLGSTVASVQEVSAVMSQMQGAEHVLVRNHAIAGASFNGIERTTIPTIDIPNLNEDAAEAVDLMDSSFLSFITQGGSRVLRGYVETWLESVFAQFLKLRIV